MSDVEMYDLVDTKVCDKCCGEKTGEWLDQAGALWKENSRKRKLFIVSKFSKFMLEFGKESETEVYSVRMSNSKLKDRYSDTLTLFTGKAEATSNYWTK